MDKNLLLYHYTTFESLASILESKELWLFSANSMNDTSDRRHGNDCVMNAIKMSESSVLHELHKNISQKKLDEINEEQLLFAYYLMSFCRENNRYLWSKYGKKHTGIAVVFDEKEFKAGLANIAQHNIMNQYSPEFSALNFHDIRYGTVNDYIEKPL